MPQTAQQAAASLFATVVAHPATSDILDTYGIEATQDRVQQITRELLSLNLFWLHQALTTVLSKPDGELVFTELCLCVRAQWHTTLGLAEENVRDYFDEADLRRKAYDRIVREGGSPLAVFTETADILESAWVVCAEDRQKVLALLIDSIAVEDIGVVVEALDLMRQ